MKKVVVLSCFYLFVYGCGTKNTDIPKQDITPSSSTPDSLNVLVLKAEIVSKAITLPAELISYEKVNICAKIPAYIRQINVDIGSVVRKGQTLVLLEAPELQAKTAEAIARAETIKTKLKTSQDLFQRNSSAAEVPGAIAAAEVERSHNQYLTDQAEHEAAQRYAASMQEIQDYLIITAPFDGVITMRNMDIGSLAGGGEKPILVLENNHVLRLRVAVPEAYVGYNLNENSTSFSLKAEPTSVYNAQLTRKSGSIDPINRSELWEFSVPNSSRVLKSGMFANAKLNFSKRGPSFTVPYSAITTSMERKFIIRIKEGQTQWVDVQQGLSLADKVEIFGAIAAGDTILLKSSEEIKPKSKVVIKI